jgi:hypothetical protein
MSLAYFFLVISVLCQPFEDRKQALRTHPLIPFDGVCFLSPFQNISDQARDLVNRNR